MADQCIVCLENLDVQPTPAAAPGAATLDLQPSESALSEADNVAVSPRPQSAAGGAAYPAPTNNADDSSIAEIEVCGHVLHDACLREWTGKANSCPICRQSFNSVNVYDKVGGTKLSTYTVQDKKQVAEFDAQAWLDENPEEAEPSRPCIICQNPEHEELTLLCDGCDAPYHTYCVGLECVPRGHWLCMECNAQYRAVLEEELEEWEDRSNAAGRSDYLPRTQATMRRARRRARSDEWQGAWGQIASHVFDILDLDLDNHDDDEALHNYRRAQRRRERERQEYQRWQQRLSIANRLGAGASFAANIARGLPQRTQPQQPPPPPPETAEEKQAWGDLERAMEVSSSSTSSTNNAASANNTTPNTRKRKSRSATASPREPPQQPERRLKRPRTRRMPQSGEPSSSRQNGEPSSAMQNGGGPSNGLGAPSFLSSLLKEVEANTPSDDENVRVLLGTTARPTVDASSPATSPSPSGPSSPRALSATPPPRGITDRPGSPLALSTHIEPVYFSPAGFSPTRGRNGSDQSGSDSESTAQRQRHRRQNGSTSHSGIRHPQPRRHTPVHINTDIGHDVRSPESSPTRESLSLKAKESITAIIKAALKPHYKSGSINADQYTIINRDLSRKLYKEVPEETLSDETRRHYEKMATKEVARAISELKEIRV
ncbi:hypothetical protein JX265_007021 [Neoarthrinium moseri]|uniref:PHD and RING finger domain-containing protein n=1 Tax=Neoarthrinium moseri TaxID=1658444 RepID=A0A9Q0APQ5_9PEZI|nr:hypothetical protein JX266_009176 [Neoarthrinium moseri]KAI1868198.1 hypothetical protein JX265_007021 [Neoarthrinium moseri]